MAGPDVFAATAAGLDVVAAAAVPDVVAAAVPDVAVAAALSDVAAAAILLLSLSTPVLRFYAQYVLIGTG